LGESFDFPPRVRLVSGSGMHQIPRVLIALTLLVSPALLAEEAKETPAPKEALKEAAAEAPIAISKEILSKAQASAVVIRTLIGGGSGFIAEIGGKTYVVTNQHVVLGAQAQDIKITDASGKLLRPVRAEIATNGVDLIRLELAGEYPTLKISNVEPTPTEDVVAIGNSLDAGVITVNPGKIIGVGSDEVESDCKFVPGNSGGPLINQSGEVIGVPTKIVFGDKKDRTTEGTRYAENRRFSTRIRNSTEWMPVSDWKKYVQVGAVIEAADQIDDEVCRAANIIISNDGSSFRPSTPQIAEALDAFERLRAKIDKMKGQMVTENELARNNNILATTYRVSTQKLRDSLTSSLRALESITVPPQWKWVAAKRKDHLARLKSLYEEMDSESKSKPRFMSFK
jgi:hypothetical protein